MNTHPLVPFIAFFHRPCLIRICLRLCTRRTILAELLCCCGRLPCRHGRPWQPRSSEADSQVLLLRQPPLVACSWLSRQNNNCCCGKAPADNRGSTKGGCIRSHRTAGLTVRTFSHSFFLSRVATGIESILTLRSKRSCWIRLTSCLLTSMALHLSCGTRSGSVSAGYSYRVT